MIEGIRQTAQRYAQRSSYSVQDWRKALQRLFPVRYRILADLARYYNNGSRFPEMLYLGDSVVERVADHDQDRRTLGKMVVDELAETHSVALLTYSAYHMLLYHRLMAALATMKNHPQLVILPINIRSFSPQWDYQPHWQYEEEMAVLQRYAEEPGHPIGRVRRDPTDVPAGAELAYRNARVVYPLSEFATIGQFLDLIRTKPESDQGKFFRKQQIFIFNYAYPLVAGHRKLIALSQLLDLLSALGVKCVAYMTPINIEAAVRYAGQELRRQVEANVRIIQEVLAARAGSEHFHFCDWCFDFASEFFFYRDLATEHMNDKGRQELAKRIAREVRAMLDLAPA